MNDLERRILHFKYWILILILLLIAVATDRWTAQKDFTSYLSNAATMTSLVLGLVAIFYSFISNNSLSKSLGSITAVSKEVEATRNEIANYVEISKETFSESTANTNLLRNASENVSISLTTLDETLKAISYQNQTLESLVTSLPSRIEQLETKFDDVAKILGEKPPQAKINASDSTVPNSLVENFLARPSLSYNLVTYAVVLADLHKKPLSLAEVCEAISLDQPNTMSGFLMAMNAAQLTERKIIKDKVRTYDITYIHPYLKSRTKNYIVEYVERTFSEQPNEKLEWLSKLSNLEVLFSEPT